MKNSFFKEYYLYRLRELRGFFIASCVLSFLSGPLTFTALVIVQYFENTDYTGGYGLLSVVILGLYILMLTIPALILLGMIIPIASRRYLNRRACVDTMGALPITYKQRYWGDLLAELTAYAAPVAAGGLYMLAAAFAYANNGNNDVLFSDVKQTQLFLSSMALTLVFSCIGGLALSNLMAQCSGKIGSGIMYSVLIAFLLPTLVLSLGSIGAASAIGVDEMQAATDACSAVPPIGWLFYFFFAMSGDFFVEMRFALTSPIMFIILLAIIAAFVIGGYFIGKKRKPELVGESLMFEAASCAVSIGIAAAVMSIFLRNITSQSKASDYIVMLVVTFVIFMAFELLHRRKKIKIVGALIRYACVCAAGLGFFALMRLTSGLGAENYLPKPGSVSEVSISSGLRLNHYNEYVFDDKNAVKVVIDQHKELLDHKGMLSTGDDLVISYKLKNGMEITRRYDAKNKEAVTNFSKPLVDLPQKGNNPLNLLRDESIELSAAIKKRGKPAKTSTDPYYTPDSPTEYQIKPEKVSELRQLLISDIENNFRDYFTDSFEEGTSYGSLRVFYSYNYNGYEQKRLEYYHIEKEYARTIAFLEDPDNLITAAVSFDPENTYRIEYSFEGGNFQVRFSEDNNLPPELYALLTAKEPGEEYSERFSISCYEDLGTELGIKKSDEKRAAELFLNAVKNHKFDEDARFHNNDYPED